MERDATGAAERFKQAFPLHIGFGVFAFVHGYAFYLQSDTSSAMGSFGRDVMGIVAFMVGSRLLAQRVGLQDLRRGWLVGSVTWAATNALGWISMTYHLNSSRTEQLSVDMTVLWVVAHVFFGATNGIWPVTPACLVATHLMPYAATVVQPDYLPLYAQRSSLCAALLLGQLLAAMMRRSYSKAASALRDRAAEARLNHMIKGNCGAAIMGLQGMHKKLRDQEGSTPTRDPTLKQMSAELELPLEMLKRAVQWCHRRQMFVQLETGVYRSARSACDVRELLQRTTSSEQTVELDVHCPRGIRIDQAVLEVVIEEALSNARKYREPGTHITLRAEFQPPGCATDCWWLRNSHEHEHGGQQQSENDTGWLRLTLENVSQRSMRVLDKVECERVFQEGYKAHAASSTSDGLGLSSVTMAASAAGGFPRLRMFTDDNGAAHTVFELAIPALNAEPGAAVVNDGLAPFHKNYAEGEDDDLSDLDEASERPLVCVGVDDDGLMRDVLEETLFSLILSADMERSRMIGETPQEQEMIIDLALGKLDPKTLKPLPSGAAWQQADVAFFDENLHGTTSGSDMAAELRARGFHNVVCMLTGSSDEEVRRIGNKPGIDLAFVKGGPSEEMKKLVFRRLKSKRKAQQAGQPRPASSSMMNKPKQS